VDVSLPEIPGKLRYAASYLLVIEIKLQCNLYEYYNVNIDYDSAYSYADRLPKINYPT